MKSQEVQWLSQLLMVLHNPHLTNPRLTPLLNQRCELYNQTKECANKLENIFFKLPSILAISSPATSVPRLTL